MVLSHFISLIHFCKGLIHYFMYKRKMLFPLFKKVRPLQKVFKEEQDEALWGHQITDKFLKRQEKVYCMFPFGISSLLTRGTGRTERRSELSTSFYSYAHFNINRHLCIIQENIYTLKERQQA